MVGKKKAVMNKKVNKKNAAPKGKKQKKPVENKKQVVVPQARVAGKKVKKQKKQNKLQTKESESEEEVENVQPEDDEIEDRMTGDDESPEEHEVPLDEDDDVDEDEEEEGEDVSDENEQDEAGEEDEIQSESNHWEEAEVAPTKKVGLSAKNKKSDGASAQFKASSQAKGDSSFIQKTSRIYINNISRESTEDSVREFFETNGLSLVDLFVPRDGGCLKGFGFAELKDIESAAKAVGLSGNSLDGRDLFISFAKPRKTNDESFSGEKETNVLFIKNLSTDTTKDGLQEYFSDATEVRVMTNQDGSCRGHAFVEFSDHESAKSALETMNGSEIDGNEVSVTFAYPRRGVAGAGRFSRGGRSQGNFRGRGEFRSYGNNSGDRNFGGYRGDGGSGGFSRGGFGRGRDGRQRFGGGSRGGFKSGGGFFGSRGRGGNFRGGQSRGSHVRFDDD